MPPPKFASTLEKIESSSAFTNFKQSHNDAELCAGFFVIDYLTGANQHQIDYCLDDGRIFTFIVNNEIQYKQSERIEGQEDKKLEKLDRQSIRVDLDDVEKILEAQKIGKKINKIIAVLHKHQGKGLWNLNCMLEGMEILQVHINAQDGEVMKFEKKNMFDFIKKQ